LKYLGAGGIKVVMLFVLLWVAVLHSYWQNVRNIVLPTQTFWGVCLLGLWACENPQSGL